MYVCMCVSMCVCVYVCTSLQVLPGYGITLQVRDVCVCRCVLMWQGLSGCPCLFGELPVSGARVHVLMRPNVHNVVPVASKSTKIST